MQRLMEMKADTAERTRHERGRREKRRAEKEAAKLQERYVATSINVFSISACICHTADD